MEEAEIQIFGSQGRVKVRKRNFTSLEVQAEMTCGSELHIIGNEDRVLVETPNFRSLVVKAERKYGSETSHLWRYRQR